MMVWAFITTAKPIRALRGPPTKSTNLPMPCPSASTLRAMPRQSMLDNPRPKSLAMRPTSVDTSFLLAAIQSLNPSSRLAAIQSLNPSSSGWFDRRYQVLGNDDLETLADDLQIAQ